MALEKDMRRAFESLIWAYKREGMSSGESRTCCQLMTTFYLAEIPVCLGVFLSERQFAWGTCVFWHAFSSTF